MIDDHKNTAWYVIGDLFNKHHPKRFIARHLKPLRDGLVDEIRMIAWMDDDNHLFDYSGGYGELWKDTGGTVFGPGPYIKVPYCLREDGWEENAEDSTFWRMRCPLGYPDDIHVDVEQIDGAWVWILTRKVN